MDLSPAHFKFLRASGLSSATVELMACRSIPSALFSQLSPTLAERESILAFPYPGIEGFTRYRIFPPLDGMKYFQPPGSVPHIYLLPQVRAVLANPNIELTIAEGEKKGASLTQHGIPTIGIGGVWNWLVKDTCELLPEFDQVAFVARNVLIVFDSDTWTKPEIQRALYALGKAIEARGGKVEALIIPPTPSGEKQGADDFIVANGIGKFKELKRIKLRHDGLSQHKSWWEGWRQKKSKDDKAVAKLATQLAEAEPWELSVDGTALLDEIRATFKRFVVTVEPDAITIETLWVVFAHAIDAFGIAPILAFWSPVPECGKTINQSLIGKLVPKPLEAASLTEAVVFRVVEKFKPTILVDEAADMLTARPELLSLLRAAHQNNKAFVYRTVGDSHEVTSFSTWAPKSLAITKNKIEDALASRCLIIRMHRKTRGEKTERFSSTKEYPDLEVLRRKAARWVKDNFENIRDAAPQNIPDIENRNLDNYEPLFKIAHVVGGQWPQFIHAAALKLLGGASPVQESRSLELLKDIKSVFEERDFDRIASAELVEALAEKQERPWSEYNKGRQITQNQISKLLKDFQIYSRKIWADGKALQGYLVSQFEDAFSRYLPQDPPFTESEPEGRKVANENNDLGQKTQPEGMAGLPVEKHGLSIEKDGQPSALPVENSETEEADTSSPNNNGFDPNYRFPGETVDECWTRIKADPGKETERIMNAKDVLNVFPGARILTAEEAQAIKDEAEDWQAIRAEQIGWQQDDYRRTWRQVAAPKPKLTDACDSCGGKLIDARWPDGNVTVQCHGCGRETKCSGPKQVKNKTRLTRVTK